MTRPSCTGKARCDRRVKIPRVLVEVQMLERWKQLVREHPLAVATALIVVFAVGGAVITPLVIPSETENPVRSRLGF